MPRVRSGRTGGISGCAEVMIRGALELRIVFRWSLRGTADEGGDRRRRRVRSGHRPSAPAHTRGHRVRGGRLRGRPRQHGDGRDRDRRARRRHRLRRLQRPQLPPLRAPARPAERPVAAIDHELLGQRRERRLRVQRRVAERPVRQPRAPRHALVSSHDRRPRALQPRRACAADLARGSIARSLARGARLLARLRRAADRAAGVGGLVRGSCAAVELPGAVPGRVLRQPRDAGVRRPATLEDDPGRLAALRGRADPADRFPACASAPPSAPCIATTTTSP